MDYTKEQSLVDALSYCGLRTLPEEWDKENIYLKALALAMKVDGTKSYVLMQKDINGEDRMVKDFGTSAVIHTISSVHPFMYLDQKWMPIFKGKTKDERVEWLEKNDVEQEEIKGLTVKQLEKKILNVAMKNALEQINRS